MNKMKAKLVKHESGFILYDEDNITIGAEPNVLSSDVFSKLCIKNCQAIERGYDLDELAKDSCSKVYGREMNHRPHLWDEAFSLGFQKAIEILGDKKFSEFDLRLAMHFGKFGEANNQTTTIGFIQSLQQTEWDVEIVEFKADDLKSIHNEWYKLGEPKLDADGCLILKVKSE